MPLKGIFLLDIIPQNLMLTHEGQATQVPHNMEMEPRDVYFYKIINSANKQGFHVSEIPLDRTLDLKKKKELYNEYILSSAQTAHSFKDAMVISVMRITYEGRVSSTSIMPL